MNEILVKIANTDVIKELKSIKFDKSYLFQAINKYQGCALKVTNLTPPEANILKQLCLSLGFDCAVSRDTITCNCEFTDCIIFASISGYKKLSQKLERQPFRLQKIAEKIKTALDNTPLPLNIRNYLFDWSRPYIMGILNITPDSFSDGGKYVNENLAVEQVLRMIDEGADIIDIGGESTRPLATPICAEKEIERVIPVIRKIRELNIKIPISIDTRNYISAKLAIEAGADIVNDVSGLEYDKELFDFVCTNNIPTVIMHSTHVSTQKNGVYGNDLVEDIYKFLFNKIETMIKTGHQKSNIIADVGIGFGKSQEDCFQILKRHEEFLSLGVPMLLGISRKSFIRNEFNLDCEESDIPTALYSAMLSDKCINIHRVHNVKQTKKFLDFVSKIV